MKPSGNESGLAGGLSVATHRGVFQFYSLKRAAHSSTRLSSTGTLLGDSFAWLPMSQLTCLHPSSITGLRQWRPTGRSEVRAGTFESIVFHLKHSEIRERAGHSVSMGIKISNLFG